MNPSRPNLEDRRRWLRRLAGLGATGALPLLAPALAAPDPFEGDPFKSHPWPDMRREFLGKDARVQFDDRVKVSGPKFAEDPMNVPISVRTDLRDVEQITVVVDRNPIRKVLDYWPLQALPAISFRFKLEQASPVRAAVRTKDGVWHVGGTWVDSSGGGCTVSGVTRSDGSWVRTLGQVHARMFASSPVGDAAARLRLQVMHPMDTGLVGGIPAFYVNRLSVRDGDDRELARLATFEPVSENPVFSFDFPVPPKGGVRVVGSDNGGNRIQSRVPSP